MSSQFLTNNNQDAQALGEAYTTLINKLPGFENSIQEIFDLSDGHTFSLLLRNLDRMCFKTVDKIKDDNWIPKITNLKKVFAFMELFLHKNKGKEFRFTAPDFLVIAKKQDVKEQVKFCQQVFYVLFLFSDDCPSLCLGDVTSSLPSEYQDLIARACNEITAQQAPSNPSPSSSNNQESNAAHLRQMEALKEDHEREIERLKRDYDVMMEELKHNRTIMDESQAERKAFLQKIKMYEESSALAGDFSKAEALFKQEIDELRKSLAKAEEKRQEAEYLISKKDADLSSQEQQLASLRLKCEQFDQLESKVRELKQTNDRLQRSDNTVSKYKKRLEDFEDIKKRLKASEDENFKQVQANSRLEEEVHKLNGFKHLVDSYKEQMIELENKINTVTIEKERKQIENRGLKETISILEIERDRYQEESMAHESKLRDMELGQAPLSELISSGETNLNEVQVEVYKTKIIKLEQELSAIRNGTRESGPTQRIIILESMLEDSKKARAKVEEELIVAHRKNIMLDEELKRFQSDDPSDKLSYDLSLNLRVRLSETEEELSQCKRKLAETQVALESCRNELLVAKSDLSMVGKDQLDAIALAKQELAKVTERLTAEKDSALQKFQDLESDSRKQMQQVNQLLMDKDALRTQSLQQKDMLLENERTIGELKATLVALETRGSGTSADELSEAKTRLAKETGRCMELREENIRLKGLEEKLSLQLKLLEEKINASEKEGGHSHGPEDGILKEASALKSELKSKESEVEKLKEQMEDIQTQHRRELAFMSSAWHELGIKAQRDHNSANSAVNGRPTHSSWLSKQRSTLNVQLKRR